MKLVRAPDQSLLALAPVQHGEGALYRVAADAARGERLGSACWKDVAVGVAGEVWATNGQGLARLDPASGERVAWRYLERGHGGASSVVVDRAGDPWVVVYGGGSGGGDASALVHLSREAEPLEERDVDLDAARLYLPPVGAPLASSDRLAWGPDGRRWRLWVHPGWSGKKCALFTASAGPRQELSETRLLLEEEPLGVAPCPDGSAWVAFASRVSRVDPAGSGRAEAGLPSPPLALLSDEAGGLWLLLGPAPGGLVRLGADGALLGSTPLGEGWSPQGVEPRPIASSLEVAPARVTLARLQPVGWGEAVWGAPPDLPELTAERLREGIARAEGDADWSSGQVTRPFTLGRAGKADPGGLYCGVIFGGPHPDRCACGQLRLPERAGEVCAACRTAVLGASARVTRLGHVGFPEPVSVAGPSGEVSLTRLPVTPAALRRPDDPLNARYQGVIKAVNGLAKLRELGASPFIQGQAREKVASATEALLRESAWSPFAFLSPAG
jgi:hypothetical protein